jgi:hypothetical protein
MCPPPTTKCGRCCQEGFGRRAQPRGRAAHACARATFGGGRWHSRSRRVRWRGVGGRRARRTRRGRPERMGRGGRGTTAATSTALRTSASALCTWSERRCGLESTGTASTAATAARIATGTATATATATATVATAGGAARRRRRCRGAFDSATRNRRGADARQAVGRQVWLMHLSRASEPGQPSEPRADHEAVATSTAFVVSLLAVQPRAESKARKAARTAEQAHLASSSSACVELAKQPPLPWHSCEHEKRVCSAAVCALSVSNWPV